MNIALASDIITKLAANGVKSFIVCAGSYNSPLVFVLQKHKNLDINYHFDERGAAFFALGRAKRDSSPVAVITTSGTAVAECLPAVIEAYFSELPLVIVSADRPVRFMETGAPQVINQGEVLSSHLKSFFDLSKIQPFSVAAHGPTHINVRFEEPILEGELEHLPPLTLIPMKRDALPLKRPKELENFINRAKSLLVLVGALTPHEQDIAINFLKQLNTPIFAEPLSGLIGNPTLKQLLIKSGDGAILKYKCDSVLRIGSVPTTSFWRDLSRKPEYRSIRLYSVSSQRFSGTDRKHSQCAIENLSLCEFEDKKNDSSTIEFLTRDSQWRNRIDALISELPKSEVGMLAKISENIPQQSVIYLGNSLPIREWGIIESGEKQCCFHANRGANGIDGQLATFSGLLDLKKESWGIFGDLTALYDTTSFSLLAQRPEPFRVVIINNGGGRIFSGLPSFSARFPGDAGEKFVNQHSFNLSAIATSFGLRSEVIETIPEKLSKSTQVIELRPSQKESELFWKEYKSLI